MVHGGQADVLVRPAIAGNVVGVEQFVVVKAGNRNGLPVFVDAVGQAKAVVAILPAAVDQSR